ncbi:MAG: hypothetical protein QMC95_17455 [Desulfitobacteriaceae bacterium]|nr:hypothetical protein [Desulfitobacteriaceae bacterium]MDI6915971.1 hypothetical protein [Desulfitobacteriaceae bacterium]
MKKRKGLLMVLLALSLLLGFSGIATAAGMSGMDMGNSSTVPSAPNTQHKATAGMDPNMPGMQSGEEKANHESSGVDWPVVDGFAMINLLVIGTAGVLKFKKKIQSQPQI